MTPRQEKITAKDLAARNPSARVRAIYDSALKHAFEKSSETCEIRLLYAIIRIRRCRE